MEIEGFDEIEIIEVGNIVVVLEKYDDENLEIECINPDGSYKWLEPSRIQHFRLRRKDPASIRRK